MAGRIASAPRRFAVIAAALSLCLLGIPSAAWAHGLLTERADLPIPAWLFAWGGSLVLIVSFVVLTLAWHEARFEGDSWRPVPKGLSGALLNRLTSLIAGTVGFLLLGLVVWTGLNGTDAPDRNFSVTFVFVTFWLGLVPLSVLFGDLFRAFNPWRAAAETVAWVFRVVARQSTPPPLRYPEKLGRWPAAAGILAFAWFELVYTVSGFQVGLTPHSVAIATLIYSAITSVGMALFGISQWLERGEAFSVYFGMLARLAPFEARNGRLGVRRPLEGTAGWARVPGSAALVMTVIGVTAFDGAAEGVLGGPIDGVREFFEDAGLSPIAALRIANSVFLAVTIGFVAAIFWAGVNGMHTVRTSLSTRELARQFIHSFIPIALAYVVAHYLSLFFFQEQAQFGYVLSDPFGDGSDLFGTADTGIDYGSLGAETVWYLQVGTLVAGHVVALALGHDRALKLYGDPRTASRSQYWMLGMMVGFTSLGLFLLSQANA